MSALTGWLTSICFCCLLSCSSAEFVLELCVNLEVVYEMNPDVEVRNCKEWAQPMYEVPEQALPIQSQYTVMLAEGVIASQHVVQTRMCDWPVLCCHHPRS